MVKVFLSAGHGGNDPGAVAYGMKEKEVNLNIMLACKEELERNGVEVICSRLKDKNDPVNSEVKEANASKADIAVSFHTNAGGGDGSESYYYYGSREGIRLAKLCEKYTKEIGQNSRGIKDGSKLRFIKGTTMTAVLCECAFIDNDKDNNIIDTVNKQKTFGVAYAKAILEYLNIKTDFSPYMVKIDVINLNIRKGPGTNFDAVGITGKGIFTIVEESSGNGSKTGWGKLKSNAGWISLDYTTKI